MHKKFPNIFGAQLAVTVSLMILAATSCALLDDSPGEYPDGETVNSEDLFGEWRSSESRLSLGENGNFSAEGVLGRYFECSHDAENGVREKTGKGIWHSRESLGASTVFLDFSDKCYATLTVGRGDDGLILWNPTEDQSGGFVRLSRV